MLIQRVIACVLCLHCEWGGWVCVHINVHRRGPYVCMYKYMQACTHAYGSQRFILHTFLSSSIPYILRLGLSLDLEIMDSANLASQLALDTPSLSPEHWDYKLSSCPPQMPALWILGIQTLFLVPHEKKMDCRYEGQGLTAQEGNADPLELGLSWMLSKCSLLWASTHMSVLHSGFTDVCGCWGYAFSTFSLCSVPSRRG